MSNKIIVVTPPDDIQVDGLRILLVDISSEQSAIMSDALTKLKSIPNIITYMWNSTDNYDWLIDKKQKSDLIIFNANSENNIIVGYLAAQKNSYYFGELKILNKVNDSAIYTIDQLFTILEDKITDHGIR